MLTTFHPMPDQERKSRLGSIPAVAIAPTCPGPADSVNAATKGNATAVTWVPTKDSDCPSQYPILSDTETAHIQRLASAHPRLGAAAHRRFLQLRESAYEALVHDLPDAVEELTSAYRTTLHKAHLRHEGSSWAWSERSITLQTPHDRVTRHVIALLTSPHLGQLHQCEDAACGWVYLNTSPRRNRRWCSAADCGNRNRARRYYARHH